MFQEKSTWTSKGTHSILAIPVAKSVNNIANIVYYNASNKKLSTLKSPKEPKMIVSSDYSNDVLYTLLIEGILRTYDCNTFTFIEEKKLGDYNLIAADKSQPNFFAAAGDMILSSFKNGAKKDIKIDY